MTRPSSITLFERLYGASIILWLLNVAFGWKGREAMIASNRAIANDPEMMAAVRWVMPGSVVVVLGVSLLLLFLVARRGSEGAKWVLVVFTGLSVLGALGVLATLARGLSPDVLTSVVGLAVTALSVAATAMLFRPDARPWFGEEDDADAELPA